MSHAAAGPGEVDTSAKQNHYLAYGGAGALVLGSLGPWASVLGFSANGIDGDGWFTLIFGLVAAVATWETVKHAPTPRFKAPLVAVICAGLAVALMVYEIINIYSSSSEFFDTTVRASPGWGAWLATIGAIALAIGATRTWRTRESDATTAPGV